MATKLQKEIASRFLKAIDQVCTDKQYDVQDLCKTISLNQSTVSILRSKPQSIKADILAEFCIKYGYSATWVIFGTGEMKDNRTTRTIEAEVQNIYRVLENIVATLLNEVLKPGKNSKRELSAVKELIKQFQEKTN